MRGVITEQVPYSAAEEAEAILFAHELDLNNDAYTQPLAMSAHEALTFDESERRFQQLLGSIAVNGEVTIDAPKPPNMTILSALHEAKRGSKQAEAMLDINIATTVTEACFKYDHVTKIAMQLNEHGELIQFGQTMQEMHHNAIAYRQERHKKLRDVTHIEALNGHCIEDAAKTNLLNDYYFIVDSLVPQDVPEQDLQNEGYFLNTLTFVTQGTTREADAVTTESIFSKGTTAAESESFARRIAQRHDLASVSRVRQRLGLPTVETTEDALKGVFIHKSLLPNGLIDYKRMLDQEASNVASVRIKTDAYYEQLPQRSKEREQSLQGTKQMVKEALLQAADTIHSPMEAVQRLWDFTKEFTVIAAVENRHIDARIFGKKAAAQIEESRVQMNLGNIIEAQIALRQAVQVAIISGCGGGSGGKKSAKSSKSNKQSSNSETDEENDPDSAIEQNEDWTWKRGQCRVDACPTRPGKTMVGPCAVCKRCQKLFDKGIDPTKFAKPKIETVSIQPASKALFTKETVELAA